MIGDQSAALDECRLKWLEQRDYLKRKTLFLDLKYWIQMVERTVQPATLLFDMLDEYVEANRVICPVSPSLVMELHKLPDSPKRDACCALINKFSGGLSLRVCFVTFMGELERTILGRPLTPDLAYSCILDAFGLSFVLDVAESGFSQDMLAQIAEQTFYWMAEMPVETVLKEKISGLERSNVAGDLQSAWSQVCAEEAEARKGRALSFREALQAEFPALVRAFSPQIVQAFGNVLLGPESLDMQRWEHLAEYGAREILTACPTFQAQHRLLAALRANRRRVKANDLWDVHHVSVAAPYVNCLATDAGTRHICTHEAGLDARYGTTIVSSPTELTEWLSGLE